MRSRLSSLLVRDGLVGVKRMEHAFQRQVIYGGCLDTILLEMNLLAEERLLQYLSLATGLPPATRSETDVFDPEALAKCPVDAARQFRVVPLCFEEGALRVLVHDPVDLGLLEELANDLECPVQPLVVPEYRFHLVFARTYGGTPNARFVALAKRAEEATPSSPVGRARTIIVEESGPLPLLDEDSGEHVVVDVRLPSSRGADTAVPAPAVPAPAVPAPAVDDVAVAGAEVAGAEVAGAEVAGAEVAGAEVAGAEVAGAEIAGAEIAGAEVAGAEVAGAEVARERLAAAQTQPLGVEGTLESPPRPSRRAPRETILGVGIPETASVLLQDRLDPHDAPLDTPPGAPPGGPDEASVRKVITAPMGSRNAPAGRDRVVGPAGAGQEPSRLVGGELSSEPLPVAQARVELAAADDRDLIFGVLLRALRDRAWYAGLLTVQGGAAIGRIAIVGDDVDRADIGQVLIPLDIPSAFQTVAQSAAPHIGPIATGDAEIDGMIHRMGGDMPPSALLLPVVLRGRVVAMAVAHDGQALIDVGAVSELLPLASMAADAISRLIVKAKAAGKLSAAAAPPAAAAAPDPAPAATRPVSEPEPLPPPPHAGTQAPQAAPHVPDGLDDLAPGRGSEAGNGAAGHADDGPEISMSIDADEPESMDELLDIIEGADPEAQAQAQDEALLRPDELLVALAARFPGRLDVDRYELGGRILPAAQHGPLLALVVEIGDAAAGLLVAQMRDSRREVRYYATLCAAEVRPRAALGALVERLFDSDYGTRNAAIQALSGYSREELDHGLLRARQALHSEDAERIQAAANALARIADTRAIPDLLDAQARGDKGSEHARRALIQLTKQDFGSSTRKWRAWWAKHKKLHRIEWLIDGLAHKDENIRRSAVEDLRKLTGEYFDFHYDAPRREREQARQRWLDWWGEIGTRRFTRPDERYRATGVVPGKEL